MSYSVPSARNRVIEVPARLVRSWAPTSAVDRPNWASRTRSRTTSTSVLPGRRVVSTLTVPGVEATISRMRSASRCRTCGSGPVTSTCTGAVPPVTPGAPTFICAAGTSRIRARRSAITWSTDRLRRLRSIRLTRICARWLPPSLTPSTVSAPPTTVNTDATSGIWRRRRSAAAAARSVWLSDAPGGMVISTWNWPESPEGMNSLPTRGEATTRTLTANSAAAAARTCAR